MSDAIPIKPRAAFARGDALAATRATLREKSLASPLCDADRLTRESEETPRGL